MLHDSAVLVKFEKKSWSPYKFDKTATSEVEYNHKVNNAGRFNKHLFKGNIEFKKIQSALSNAYLYHISNSLPWMFDGVNIVPSCNALEYVAKMNGLRSDLFTTVSAFDLDAAKMMDRQRLGTLYDDNDYPSSKADFEAKFDILYQFMPVPTVSDFRVDIPEEEKAKLEAQLKAVSANIVNEILNRVKVILEPVITQCSKTEKTRWHKSLKTNILEAVPVLRTLNLENNAEINSVIDKLESFGNTIDVEALKDNEEIRNDVLKRARDVTGNNVTVSVDNNAGDVNNEPDYQAELNELLEGIAA